MEEKNIKIIVNVECTEKSCAKEEQIAGYLLRAIAGVTANNKCLITNYACEITGKNDNKLRKGCITEKPKLTKEEKRFLDELDPSWTYMLRNGYGQLYLAKKAEPDPICGKRKFDYLYLKDVTTAEFTFVEAEEEGWTVADLKKLEVEE